MGGAVVGKSRAGVYNLAKRLPEVNTHTEDIPLKVKEKGEITKMSGWLPMAGLGSGE